MSLPCLLSQIDPTTQEECIPECVRWTSVNQGEPIAIFHDTSNWEPSFFANINATDPTLYLQTAIDTWNEAYECGTLFELNTDRAQARVTVEYVDPDDPNFCEFSATALCVCDAEGDVCVRQLDHSTFFFPDTPSEVKMYKLPCFQNTRTEIQFTNTMLHELGHVLGMGHVYSLPISSIMGDPNNRPDRDQGVRLYDWDIQELERRYPCGCTLANPIMGEQVYIQDIELSSNHCPGCADIH